jgi:hypothetical protein
MAAIRAPGPVLFAVARTLPSGAVVWLSHGLAAAIQHSVQVHPQLGLPGSMNIGGGAARAEEGFLLVRCVEVEAEFRRELAAQLMKRPRMIDDHSAQYPMRKCVGQRSLFP